MVVKATKKAPEKGSKPITDFFLRVPTSSQGSVVPSTASSQSRTKIGAEPGSSQPQAVVSVKAKRDTALKSSSTSNSRPGGSSPLGLSSPRKPMDSQRLKLQTPARTASLKRGRSPDPARLPVKDRTKPELKKLQPSQAKSTPRKKARMSSPFSVSNGSSSNLVPSSQSDEEELPTPINGLSANKSEVKESVKQWRKQALPPTPDGPVPMDMDVDQPLCDESGPSTPGDSRSKTFFSAPSHILTPPYTDVSSDGVLPVPPTPIALDAATKTARIIEGIRAKAFAAVESSPEFNIADIPDELEDSDDDGILAQPLFVAPVHTNASPSSSTSLADTRQLRRSSRQRTSLGASSAGSPISHSRPSLPRDMVSSDEDEVERRAPVNTRTRPDPISLLIREREKAERNGKGTGAVLRAENLFGKSMLLEEMNLEDGDENEQLDYDNLKNYQSTMSPPLKSIDDVFLGEEDDAELAKNELNRQELNGILKDDRLALEAEESLLKREGVHLWAYGYEDAMAVDEQHAAVPEFTSAGNSITLQYLSQAMQKRDFKRATMLLKSGTLINLRAADQPGVISDICMVATSSTLHESPVSEAAFRVALVLLDPASTHENKCPVLSSFMTRTMLELGAAPQLLESAGLKIDSTPSQASEAKRESILYRTIALIAQAAIARRLISHEIPNIVVALVLVAMDPSTSHDLWREISVAVNHVCRSSSPVNGSDRAAESVIASRLVALSEKYEPVNKAALVSVFSGGAGATARIARFISYCMIVRYPSDSITGITYCDPAPLTPLLNQLVQPSKDDDVEQSDTVFAINDDTDYAAMKHYVYILGIATTNIKGYVEIQKQKAKADKRPLGATKPDTELDSLHSLLEEFHASINDLRAAHLDRSRAKAVVKQLQMRIYYQRGAFERMWKDQHNSTTLMKSWLTAKSKTS